MPPLDRTLRRGLENAVKAARRVAEQAATKALESLAVGHHEPWPGQPTADRTLRVKLRARGRQLGDALDPKTGKQATTRLVHEVAYEHWHRMLFARFLAENDLLIEPDSGVAISLDTCRELAKERGTDVWMLASRFAQTMLPEIFRADDPVLAVELAREDQLELEKIVADLGTDVFTASDSLGWCYQFWQAEKKDSVNASGVKIGADELPAVTQLFTEDYMVDFLLDNTLGAWWAGKVLAADPSIAASATSEDDLRKAVSLPGVPWAYLRFIKPDDGEGAGTWRPAAGTFDGWPRAVKDLTCLDPCMGSGHFVVAMFDRLVPLRMREEGLSETAAIKAVIRDNLYGLEIDPRCTQIGAFNLALAAWRRVGHIPLPPMHIACSGLAPNATEDEWVALAEGNSRLEEGMRRLHGLFKDAPVLGSLINPGAEGYAAFEASFAELQPILGKALAKEGSDDAEHEMAVTARGVAKAAEILGRQFTLVATNVPYLAKDKHAPLLASRCESRFPAAQRNLAYVFLQCGLEIARAGGTVAMVTLQNWLFQPAYPELRKAILSQSDWNQVVRLGAKGFQTPMWDFNVMLFITSKSLPTDSSCLPSLNVEGARSPEEKARSLVTTQVTTSNQLGQMRNTDCIVLEDLTRSAMTTLGDYMTTAQGLVTGDDNKFVRRWWESPLLSDEWTWLHLQPRNTEPYSGRVATIRWQGGSGDLHKRSKAHNFPPPEFLGAAGVAIQRMDLNATIFSGNVFGDHLAPLVPRDVSTLLPLWCFCESADFTAEVRKVDAALKVAVGSFAKVPFDLPHWETVAAERYPAGMPVPHTSDPTQWLFNGHPKDSDSPLHVAVARLVGYQWPRQTGSEFPDCPALGADGLERHADADGIVCLSSVRGEPTAADRLLSLLADAYGSDWSADLRDKLLADVDANGKTLDDWLRDSFFEQHLKLFHQRPFVWHIWDGLRDGFHCLVNYHRLAGPDGQGRRTLEKIAYEYLGDWITRQKAQQAAGEEGADARVAAAVHLQEQLAKIIEGEPPFDIFVRWKPLAEQPIGWDPDINDGVRLNIRPFMTARPLGAKAKKACILRAAPGIKWDKDRGNEPDRPKDQFPWFWTWDEESQDFLGGTKFDGKRHNDLHYTRRAKEAARAKAGGTSTKPKAAEARA
ncbi:hypothetical protein LBMAG47_14230 [Planctomycetia bacterium]|nr:hypothetical protein LBMAG47_14230 [Planctomycetia bacterium]